MAQIDWLRKKVRLHIRDIQLEDGDIDDTIRTVISDIASQTKIFKKLYGFTIDKDISLYNFRYIARLNEQVEEEPVTITFGDPTTEDLLDFLQTGNIPSPTVNKELQIEEHQSRLLDVLEIYDGKGFSALDKFEERGSSYYYCYDELWRNVNHGKAFAFAGWVSPKVEELHEEQLEDILFTVIAGVKFFLYDILHSPNDTQATNYDFLRYHQAKEELLNRYPTMVTAYTNSKRSRRWL